MGRGAEVIVGEDRHVGAVFLRDLPHVIDEGIDPPALDGGLGTNPGVASGRGAVAQLLDRLRLEDVLPAVSRIPESAGAIDALDALAHLLGTERAVLVVEAVRCAVGGEDVELHEMNVLPEDVGRRADLEVVELEVRRHQVGVPVLDDVVVGGAEEERLGRLLAGDEVFHITPQREDALLRVVPTGLVEDGVELQVDAAIDTLVVADRLAVDDRGIGERRA